MNTAPPIVHVVDDDESFRRSLRRLLEASGHGVAVHASASDFLQSHDPAARGCVIADLRMPGLSGLDLQAALSRSGNPLPVVFLTGHGDIPTTVNAMRGGAEDFLAKPVSKAALLDAVQRAFARDAEAAQLRARTGELRRRHESLTPREREVLQHIAAGKLNKEIASDLKASERTIKAHRASIMQKFQAQSPADLGRMTAELLPRPGA